MSTEKVTVFGQLKSLALSVLNITAFDKNKDGKEEISAEQKAALIGAYGEKFTDKLIAQLGSDTEASAEEVTEMTNLAKEHFDAQISAKDKVIADLKKLADDRKTALDLMAGSAEEKPKPETKNVFAKKANLKKGDVVMQVNMNASHYAGIEQAFERNVTAVAEGTTIDVSEIQKEFGKYLSQDTKNIEIYTQLLSDFETGKFMTTIPAATEYKAMSALITSVVQQFTNKWTPAGKSKFTPLTIINRRHKINVPIIPSEVLDGYLFKLYDEGLAPDQMPIVMYIWDNLIYPVILNDIENRMIAKGSFVETVLDGNNQVTAGGKPEDAMDGFETILVNQKSLATSSINFYKGAKTMSELVNMSASDLLAYVDGFADWISPFYKGSIKNIFCSPEVYKMYKRAYKKVWGANGGENPQFGTDTVDFTTFTLKALNSMYGSPILLSTPPQNFVKLRWKNDVPRVINDIQKQDYEVRSFGEFWLACGFLIGEAVFAAVPNGYTPVDLVKENWGDSSDFQKYQVEQDAVINLVSAIGTNVQSVAEDSSIAPIAYNYKGESASIAWTGTGGATTAPAGITAIIANGVVTISGTPGNDGAYGYTITVLAVKSGTNATASGTITVTEEGNVVTLVSATGTDAQTVAENVEIAPIAYSYKGASASIAWTGTGGATTPPTGITEIVTGGVVTISGTPTADGAYGYTLTVVGNEAGETAVKTGTITVTAGA